MRLKGKGYARTRTLEPFSHCYGNVRNSLITFERPDVVLPVDPGEDGGLRVLLPEVSAEGADGDQVEALPGRALHLAEGARLGVGPEAPLFVEGVASCDTEDAKKNPATFYISQNLKLARRNV